jgi:poly [ADP-ribose] polymerase
VKDHLFDEDITRSNKKEALKFIENEQDTLDTMAGQVSLNTAKDKDEEDTPGQDHDILTLLGLEIVEGTKEDYDLVKKLMDYKDPGKSSKCKKVYKVKNKKTEKQFDTWLAKQDDKKVKRYWHGSRNQNWFNIIQSGLLIRPSGAIHTGSMFGDGIYFANKAQKSINYSSLRGSYWTGGTDNKGFLALYKVHVGNEKKIKHHNSSCYSLNYSKVKGEGYDSVYAQGGADLRNDEFIVYKSEQSTIEYLIEIGN